jgi:hypothetical protein
VSTVVVFVVGALTGLALAAGTLLGVAVRVALRDLPRPGAHSNPSDGAA